MSWVSTAPPVKGPIRDARSKKPRRPVIGDPRVTAVTKRRANGNIGVSIRLTTPLMNWLGWGEQCPVEAFFGTDHHSGLIMIRKAADQQRFPRVSRVGLTSLFGVRFSVPPQAGNGWWQTVTSGARIEHEALQGHLFLIREARSS